MRTFVHTALIATIFASTVAAQVSLPAGAAKAEGAGSTTATSFQINASIGNACFITKPEDFSLEPVLYWTESSLQPQGAITSFVVRCNVGAPYAITWSRPLRGDQDDTNVAVEYGARRVPLYLDGTGPIRYRGFFMRLAEGPADLLTNDRKGRFENNRIASSSPQRSPVPNAISPVGSSTAAGTSAGQTYTFMNTALGVPPQSLPAGTYSTTVTVTLVVDGLGDEPLEPFEPRE